MCTFLHPPNALSHRKEQQAKSHLSFRMCAFSPPDFSINVHFSIATRFNKITPFLRNVRFFAAKFSDEFALFRRMVVLPFLKINLFFIWKSVSALCLRGGFLNAPIFFKFKLFSIEIRFRFRQNSNYLLDVNHFSIFKRGKKHFWQPNRGFC